DRDQRRPQLLPRRAPSRTRRGYPVVRDHGARRLACERLRLRDRTLDPRRSENRMSITRRAPILWLTLRQFRAGRATLLVALFAATSILFAGIFRLNSG